MSSAAARHTDCGEAARRIPHPSGRNQCRARIHVTASYGGVDLEGLSLVPQLKDANAKRERPAIASHNQPQPATTSHNQGIQGIQGIPQRTLARYIHYADGSKELYDMRNDPNEWANLAGKPEHAAVIEDHKKWLPKIDLPPAPNSANRVLTYDKTADEAVWEGKTVKRSDPIPE